MADTLQGWREGREQGKREGRIAGLRAAARKLREYGRNGGIVARDGSYSTANAHLKRQPLTTLAELPERNVASFMAHWCEAEARRLEKEARRA